MIKAIFFDIDATSYIHAIKDSPESTKKAFRKLKEAGYRLGICTSRSYPEMINLPEHFWELMDAVVCLGGAQIMIDGNLVVNHTLDDEIQSVIQLLDETSTPYRWVTSTSEGYLSQHDQWVEDLNTFLYQMIPPIKKYNKEKLVHLLFYPEDEPLHQTIKDMCRKNYYLRLRRSSEITAPGINKGHGILECARFWNIEQNEIAAFGDANNDLPMIQTAEIGIAMGNATELLKQHADYITDTIENDGLYKACIHFGWIKEDE
ncbi:MAG: HAD-IIB family hydrolase [Erysipelotrichaceae bacterium]|nr:HAD-IIB family hydrolase [Erysipelotrichaceae bacterium]MBQ4342946.1 HAD-IIB family hydrolase [Erysipelotrichaceae bacterium]